jgi:sigma-B regulation protein RsbU (phosphoserine phosphatase)
MVLRSIASRLALWVLAGSTLVLTATGALLLVQTREQILRQTHREASALAVSAASRIQGRLDHVTIMAGLLETLLANRRDDAASLIHDALVANRDISGISAAFTPTGNGTDAFAPFVSRQRDGAIRSRDLAGDSAHYWESLWFLGGLTCSKGCWQRPFHSESRNQMEINYSVAIAGTGAPAGLLNVDVAMDWLQQVLSGLARPPDSHVFVLGSEGDFLAHDVQARVGAHASPALLAAIGHPENGPFRLTPEQSRNITAPAWLYFVPIEGTRWTFVMSVPEASVYADVWRSFLADATLGVIALAGVALIALLVTRRMMSPLGVLADRAEHVARGELDFVLPKIHLNDEVGRLTRSFDRMRLKLALHLQAQAKAAREQQRLDSELEIAHQIQIALLPNEHYVDAAGANFELHALLRPARAVGGDLYIYFMLDATSFCAMVGDVSDKGIPAALFMARTITLAKAITPRARTPQAILQSLNRELCRGNDSCMFVTLLCGVLDIHSGELSLASAGHEPPVLCGHARARLMEELETGPALGLQEDASYPLHTLTLHEGDALLLYTDGITEAVDEALNLFGTDRLLQSLTLVPAGSAPDVYTDRLVADVDRYAAGENQADDITVLALTWHRLSTELLDRDDASGNR